MGGHAYSILDVKEIADVTLGGHLKLEDYYQTSTTASSSSSSSYSSSTDAGASSSNSTTCGVIDLTSDDPPDNGGQEPYPAKKKPRLSAASSSSVSYAQKVADLLTEIGSIRVLRMRNPWGRFEWQGDLGSKRCTCIQPYPS